MLPNKEELKIRSEKTKLRRARPAKQVGGHGVSLRELAAHLGLSLTTVSRVMNHAAKEYRIAPATQQRVLEAAASLNYHPNAFARGLRKKRSSTVGVIVPEISEGYAASVLSGIEDALLQEKFFYFVVSHRHRADLLDEYPRLLLSRAVEGIIAVDTRLLGPVPVPVVAVSGHRRKNGVLTIELDHLTAARYALSHLFDLGHRKIAFIKGQTFSSDTRSRWDATVKVCDSLGIRIDPQLVTQLEGIAPGSEPGYVATRELLQRERRFSAIVCFNDASAIGAITALHEAGLVVPHDVSVVGFDDIPAAATIRPALTTVRQPLYEMGRTAAMSLLSLIREEISLSPLRSILITPDFVTRQSTAIVSKD
ncbi:MAG TPA: LacI family DNA-binding transcriptional regulator [Acidobacteriaceae bacterium]|jgi:LacI family transcriptional regulator|nr:LacI family DNA-binding transcriptional regulator [Acidobacteriaceae bacterium]